MAHVLCLMASPRKLGNSATAAQDALNLLHVAGHTSECIELSEHYVLPCVACGVCDNPPYACPLDKKYIVDGKCDLDENAVMDDEGIARPPHYDEAYMLLERIRNADALLLASPVYFYGPPALFKGLIDRSQRYWALNEAAMNGEARASEAGNAEISLSSVISTKPAFLILTAARVAGPKLFDASLLIYRSFLSCMGFTAYEPLCLRGLDGKHEYAHSFANQELVRNVGAMWIRNLS